MAGAAALRPTSLGDLRLTSLRPGGRAGLPFVVSPPFIQSGSAQEIEDDMQSEPYKLKAAKLLRASKRARPNKTMAYPPTKTWSASGAANSGISSPVSVRPMPISTYPQSLGLGAGAQLSADTGSPANGQYGGAALNLASGTPGSYGWGLRFETYAQSIAFDIRNNGDGSNPITAVARINGEWTGEVYNPTVLGSNGDAAFYWLQLDFVNPPGTGSLDAKRKVIDICLSAPATISNVQLSTGHALIVPGRGDDATRGLFLAHSFAVGQMSGLNPRKALGHQLAEGFGANCEVAPIGVGGIGFVSAIGGKIMLDQIKPARSTGVDYDFIIFEGLYNDGAATTADITTNATAFVAELLAEFPSTPIFDIGCFKGPSRTISADRVAAEKAAFLAAVAGKPQCFHLDAIGNAFEDVSVTANWQGDGIHKSEAGNVDLAISHIVPAMAASLATLAR